MSAFGDGTFLKEENSKSKKNKKKQKLEAKKLKRETARRQIIKEYYDREVALCQQNFTKCDEKWHEVFDRLTSDDLKWNLLALKDRFIKWNQVKSNEFAFLFESFDEINCQNRVLAAGYLGALDQLLDLYNSRIGDFQRKFTERLTRTKNDFEEEQKIVNIKEERAHENLSTIISYEKEKEHLVKSKFHKNLEGAVLDLDSKHFTDMEKLENELDSAIEWLLMKIQVQIKTHFYTNNEKYKEYEILKIRDKKGLDQIVEYRFEIKQLEQKIRRYRQQLRGFIPEYNIPELLTERRVLFDEFSAKEKKLSKLSKEDREKLKLLSTESKQSITHLRSIWERRKKIIDLKALCHKYEVNQIAPSQVFHGNSSFFVNLSNQVEILALKREIVTLDAENSKLKSSLRNMLINFGTINFS